MVDVVRELSGISSVWVGVCVCVKVHVHTGSILSYSLQPPGLQPDRLLCLWNVSRQEYWSGLPFPTPGDLPDPGIEPSSLVSSALADGFFITCTTGEAFYKGNKPSYFKS